MPRAAPRPCSSPGCPEYAQYRGRCTAHATVREREGRHGDYDATWRKLRKQKLLANPMCEIRTHCVNKPILEQVATEVDHRIPIAQRPDLRLVWSNLQSACHSCHSAKTMNEIRWMGYV